MNLFSLFFPRFCVGCHKIGIYFCKTCIQAISQSELVCPVCERLSIGGETHPLCTRKFGLDGLWSLGVYQGALKKAVQKLKYRFITDIAEALVNITIYYWAYFLPSFLKDLKQGEWCIVAVPLHPKRQKWRGFNQAVLLAQLFSKKLGIPYCDALVRIKNTRQQVGLPSSKRKQNIKNAFTLKTTRPFDYSTNVLLIDDVWTTGSTLKECCYVLKRGGAKKVWAITLAR